MVELDVAGRKLPTSVAPTLGAAQPVGRKLIVGVELCAPDHGASIRGKCNRRSHKRAVCAPPRNCAVGTVATLASRSRYEADDPAAK
jgi:hypothetical protein